MINCIPFFIYVLTFKLSFKINYISLNIEKVNMLVVAQISFVHTWFYLQNLLQPLESQSTKWKATRLPLCTNAHTNSTKEFLPYIYL